MKKSRKKRAPKVSTDALNSWKQDATRDADLEKLSVRLLQCEELRQEQVLNTPFIALEALSALAGASLEGKSEEALRTTWSEAWGYADINVPLSLIFALSHAWLRQAQILIEQWKKHYNTKRPHSALGYHPSAPVAIVQMDQRQVMN